MSTSLVNPWLSRLSKICVFLTFLLILMGAVTTTGGYGMVSPNAPHVDGQLFFPADMFRSFGLFCEHAHRHIAMTVGVCVGILTAMLWRNWPAFFVSIAFMGLASIGTKMGLDKVTVAHLRVWPAMLIFVTWVIIASRKRGEKPTADQWLGLIAFICTCFQAVVGVMRVELETAGSVALATNIRTFHGVFAQVFLALLVVIAARLSPVWNELGERSKLEGARKIHVMAIALQWLYILQLACGAYIRHRQGFWAAIGTWPMAGNGLLPEQWTHAVGIHFLHTRILPILITGHVVGLAIACAKRAKGEPRITRLGWALLAAVGVQFLLGVMVIWKSRQSHITNTHVMVGALICATTALLAARSWRVKA